MMKILNILYIPQDSEAHASRIGYVFERVDREG